MQRRSVSLRLGTSAVLGLSLVAAACGGGGSDGGDSATGITVDKGVQDALSSTTTPGSATTMAAKPEPKTMDEWEKLWTAERAAVVKRIKDNKWGLSADGKTVTGPEGFTIDVSKCAVGWSNTEGLTDTAFKVGGTLALSGTLADYGNYGKSIDTLLAYYGDKGAFKDSNGKTRKAVYIQKDDAYDPAKTIPLVDELLDSEKAFAIWTLGTGPTMKTYDKLNQRCVPDLIAMTGHPAWADPINHPWTSGAPVPSYTTETQLWGTFIEQRLGEFPTDKKVVVCALVMNNDFGKVYDAGFRSYVAQSAKLKDRVEFVTETIEPTAPTITDPMTTLGSKNCAFYIAMTAGTSCTQSVVEAAQNGMKEKVKYLFQPLTCAGTSFISKEKVGGDGTASKGWHMFNPGIKDIKDPTLSADPWMVFIKDLLTKKGIDPNSSSSLGNGFGYAWPFVQTLLVAQELPGGLTRTNLVVAHRTLSMTPPTHLYGIKLEMNGNKDAYLIEGGQFAVFDSTKQVWELEGSRIDLNGKSSLCAWSQSTSKCS